MPLDGQDDVVGHEVLFDVELRVGVLDWKFKIPKADVEGTEGDLLHCSRGMH